jgi:hypothetical protein
VQSALPRRRRRGRLWSRCAGGRVRALAATESGGALAAFVLGVMVGFLTSARVPGLRATAPVIAAFLVALVVFGLAEWLEPINPLRTLIPPIVTFLPGAALTTGMRDLATGQVVSGASRLVQDIVVVAPARRRCRVRGRARRRPERPTPRPPGRPGQASCSSRSAHGSTVVNARRRCRGSCWCCASATAPNGCPRSRSTHNCPRSSVRSP